MDLEVVGRHALLFDDDATAAFVDSPDALVEWHSLAIDRYDVRHLLSAPPPPRKSRRNLPSTDADLSLESELDHERYLDLPPPSADEDSDTEQGEKSVNDGGYSAVPFSYGKPDESTDQEPISTDSGYHPPFAVPEHLVQNLPPSEKVHQIIARTAAFVSKHGGQSEIVLRVKQGDNPTFGFLMPDHHLHAYFRFLVEHEELLKSDTEKSLDNRNTVDGGQEDTGGALSLLGAMYGSGEDEDETTESRPEENKSNEFDVVNKCSSSELINKESLADLVGNGRPISKHPHSSSKEKGPAVKKSRSIWTIKAVAESGTRKDGEASSHSAVAENKRPTLPPSVKVEQSVLEPPSDLKRLVDRVVEFIVKNGESFESVLIEQDRNNGRFPFLVPSNPYYPYYLKVLKKAQQSKLSVKKLSPEKMDALVHGLERRAALSKDSDGPSIESDIPYESDRKGKFKMVIGKTKKDGQDQPPKDPQQQIGINVDAAAAAAILQAARRGMKNPDMGVFPKMSLLPNSSGPGSESGEALSFGGTLQYPDKKAQNGLSLPSDEAIARTAAVVAASEADSSEASLTKEQKLKAERLKRAKMFTAMLKGGAAPLKTQLSRDLSVELTDSRVSGSSGLPNLSNHEIEGSSFPYVDDISRMSRKSEIKVAGDEQNERRSKRRYRTREGRHGEEGREEQEEDEDEDEEKGAKDEERDHKHSRKKRRSHRSSHHSKERHKHRKKHSTLKDGEPRHSHGHDISDDERRHRRRRRHDSSDGEKRHRHRRHSSGSSEDNHDGASDDGRRHHHGLKHESSSGDKDQRHGSRQRHRDSSDAEIPLAKSTKYRRSDLKKKDLEEGEVSVGSGESKASGDNRTTREASLNQSNASQVPSQLSEAGEVPSDLRAKIRAMLMATM